MKVERVRYVPDGEVLTDFFNDRSPVSIIQGPVGSGTSTACCHKMWRISMEQEPDPLGIRKTRWLIVRNTFDQLKQTTLKTWSFWFVEKARRAFGDVKMSNPPEHRIKWDLPDGTTVQAEFIFLSLDSEDDVAKLLSMECTGVWFNEAQFSSKEIFDAAHSRAMQGRYPPLMDGGPTWKGVIADLNAPPEGHWIPYLRGDVPLPLEWDDDQRREYERPDDWKFFVQPPGLIETFENGRLTGYKENPAAENMKWIPTSYLDLIKGKAKTWIDTYVMNRVGLYRQGKPVFESFVPETHISKQALRYQPEWPLIVGLDFARNPAAVICQLIRGQMYVLDEFGMENVSAGTFAPLLKQRIMQKFPGVLKNMTVNLDQAKTRYSSIAEMERDLREQAETNTIKFWGDPTGGSKGQGTDYTPYLIFAAHGMSVAPAPGNNAISIRLEAVDSLLNKMIDGSPALLLDPHLRTLKAGMAGAYHYAKVKGQSRYQEEPYKDRFSDFCDAFQYACLGAGLGFQALNPNASAAPKPKKREKKRYSLKGRR
ncbi:hypothetical protein [Ruegeria lacuscaerulensis]|uniref:hypothetical protein n=1 Tax=Ruegeria lacuscaerulensis TaxID=55218 RepID=UPI00147BB1E6|nr:hypothetical protein [Ruegeria lacuscaerulensis]